MANADSFPRLIEARLRRAARDFPVVTVTGPRQSGKSTLCKRVFRGKPYANLELPDLRERVIADPRAFLARHPKGAILDEIQRAPELLSYLQVLVDDDPTAGRWILTGSQHLAIARSVSQSLAGRTALLHLMPLSYSESIAFPMRVGDVWTEVWRGGYPAIRAKKLNVADWIEVYIGTYLERDVRDVRHVGDLSAFQASMRLLAGRTAGLLNIASLGNDAGVAQGTIKAWISVLEATYVVSRLPPFFVNIGKRVIKTPKLHFFDSGVASWLLGVRSAEQLEHHPLRGSLFETWVYGELAKERWNRGTITELSFYRDQHGLEADFIVETEKHVFVVEVKSGRTVAGDWFGPVTRIADALRSSPAFVAGREVVSAVVYAGDESLTHLGVRVVSWRAISELFVARSRPRSR